MIVLSGGVVSNGAEVAGQLAEGQGRWGR
eukprot:COSAG06_NODE_7646_length_2428_cov_52.070846_4_plen_28_part_01